MRRVIPRSLIVAICEAAGVDPSAVSDIHLTPTEATFIYAKHPVEDFTAEVTA